MLKNTMRSRYGRWGMAIFGIVLMSVGINVFVSPLSLYTSGLMGYSQVIRTVLSENFGITVTRFDLAGVLYYIINVPILFLTYRSMGRNFVIKTLVCTSLFSLTTALIPIPATPLIDDTLTGVIVGAICTGAGDGFVLTAGCSAGGLDMLGLYFSKKNGTPVGRFGTYGNIALYVACFFLFDFSVVIYSVIYMAFTNMIVDRMHQQNINVQALIFTKNREKEIPEHIMRALGRGVTCWDGAGAYTDQPNRVLCTCINKYEQEELESIVKEVDAQAFIITTPGVHINGNFIHKV